MKDYREQLKQMLQDLAKEKEKDAEKPLPLMDQVLRTCCTCVVLHGTVHALSKTSSLSGASLISPLKSVFILGPKVPFSLLFSELHLNQKS